MMRLENVTCNLCGSDDTEHVLTGRDRILKKEGTYNLVRCRKCGLVYLNPRPDKDSLGELYGDEYQFRGKPRPEPTTEVDDPPVDEKKASGMRIYFGYPGPRPTAVEKLTNIPAYLSVRRSNFGFFDYVPGGRILDVGCGRARFLSGMKMMGWDSYGADFSDEGPSYSAAQYDLKMCYGDFHNLKLENEFFDVITMWQFLEHSYDPKGCLRKANTHLKKGGLLLAAVPNFGSAEASFFMGDWQHLDIPRHLYDFTPGTLTRLYEEAGFKVRNIIYRNPPAWMRGSMEYKRESKGVDVRIKRLERTAVRFVSAVLALARKGCLMIFIGEKVSDVL